MSSEAAPRLDTHPDTAPAGAAPRLSAPAAGSPVLVALTHDEALIELLAETSEGHEFIIVDSEADLAGEIVRRQPGVVLVDAEAATQAIDALARRLHGQFPDVGLVATGSADDQAALSSEITHGVVHRFLHRPFSAERVKLFVDSAWKRHAEERERGAGGTATAGPAAAAPSRLPPPRVLAGGALALALVAALGLWAAFRSPGTGVPAAQPALTAAAQAEIRKTLERADEALARGNLTTPGGAAALYASVLARDASNARARDGAGHVVDRLLTAAERALVMHREDDAQRLIDSARRLQPDHPRVAFLTAQVTKERERATAADRRNLQATLAETLALASQRLRAGALDEPERDNARFYVEAARVLAPNDPRVKAAQRELAARMAERDAAAARAARPAERVPQNAGAPAAAAPAPAQPSGGTPASAAAAAIPVPALAPPPAGPAAGAVPPGASDGATRPAQDVVVAGSLTRTRYVEPTYPRQARTRGAAGWVELQFTVKTDGSVGDVAVTQSEPSGLFDAAATTAVRQWRYQPVIRDGRAVEQRARIRVRFAVE